MLQIKIEFYGKIMKKFYKRKDGHDLYWFIYDIRGVLYHKIIYYLRHHMQKGCWQRTILVKIAWWIDPYYY
jgi:hypothetical protein